MVLDRMYRVFTGTKTDIVEHQANTKKEAIALSRNAVREAKERGLKDYGVVLFQHDKHRAEMRVPSRRFPAKPENQVGELYRYFLYICMGQ